MESEDEAIQRGPREETSRTFCISIDVERDYRRDGILSTRGIEEGLPTFLDELKSRGIPYDLMISGEIAEQVPNEVLRHSSIDCALGCHGQTHLPGYLNRLDATSQEAELRRATHTITSTFGRVPRVFRAPNFSANGDTIRILARLGYHVDSSVLPGRRVRKWRLKTIVDHRGVPENPFLSDPFHYPKKGGVSILEVPVTANPTSIGSPLGLGFLNHAGTEKYSDALRRATGKYVVFLAHTWEMVSWASSDPVAPWVRSASSADPRALDDLISLLDGYQFGNMDQILSVETQNRF